MMQNNESNHKFTKFLKTKGYYMLLCLCLVAVGVSGYVFLSGMIAENRAVEQSLSVPAVTGPAAEQKPDQPQTPSQEQKQEDTKAASAEVEEAEPTAPTFEQTIMPVSGVVLQDHAMDHLAYNATTRDWRVHNGVDIAAEAGTQVCAAAAGVVYTVYEDETMGMTVVIRHDGDYTTKYSSLATEVSVSPGDEVALGQVIGCVGDTALLETALGDHVHFSVTCGDEVMDPAEFLGMGQ
jgi:murein DD-endopeptidase MepM/ murein hydrolase activator NlpD